MRVALPVCVVVAAASLALPSEPSFDPWAWIVWGRELLLLDLDTTGGPSWKPLPVLFTAAFAPFSIIDSGLPAALWLVVARTGALLSVVLAFRVTRRLAGPERWTGIAAGTIAAVALIFAPQWLRYAAHGNEVPMAVALMLWGLERHLDGRRDHALIAVFLACLLRPEVFPFLALYAAWLWREEPHLRRLTAGLAVALPALWIVPDWLASGDPLGAGRKASSEPHWSLAAKDQPWLAALQRTDRIAGLPLELGPFVAAAFAVYRRDWRVLALAGVAIAWVALVVAMTQAGFSGSTRYFVPAVVIASMLTGLAIAWTVAAVAKRHVLAGAAVAVTLALAVAPWTVDRLDTLEHQRVLSAELIELHRGLVDAVDRAGGAERVLASGPPSVNRAFQTRLAWEMRTPLIDVESAGGGQGLIFSVPESPLRGQLPPAAIADTTSNPLARSGLWQVRRRAPTTLAAARPSNE
jgi:hypothetical protein